MLQLPGQEFGAFRWGYTVDPPPWPQASKLTERTRIDANDALAGVDLMEVSPR